MFKKNWTLILIKVYAVLFIVIGFFGLVLSIFINKATHQGHLLEKLGTLPVRIQDAFTGYSYTVMMLVLLLICIFVLKGHKWALNLFFLFLAVGLIMNIIQIDPGSSLVYILSNKKTDLFWQLVVYGVPLFLIGKNYLKKPKSH